jgi:hypothetical protein
MTFTQLYPDQARLFKMAFECLEYNREHRKPLVLQMHPLDIQELWNTKILFETVNYAGQAALSDIDGPCLIIADENNHDLLKIEIWVNANRPRWVPKIRIK